MRSAAAKCGSGARSNRTGRPEADAAAVEEVAGICGDGSADAGDWHRREYGGLQRGERRSAEAAALSAIPSSWWPLAECSRRRRAGELYQRPAAFAVDVSDLRASTTRRFQSMGVWMPGTANVTGVAQPEEVQTRMISGWRAGDARECRRRWALVLRRRTRIRAERRR